MTAEPWIRPTSVVLQVGGVAIVLAGISSTRRSLGMDSVTAATWRRLRNGLGGNVPYPVRRPKPDKPTIEIRRRHRVPIAQSPLTDPAAIRRDINGLDTDFENSTRRPSTAYPTTRIR